MGVPTINLCSKASNTCLRLRAAVSVAPVDIDSELHKGIYICCRSSNVSCFETFARDSPHGNGAPTA